MIFWKTASPFCRSAFQSLCQNQTQRYRGFITVKTGLLRSMQSVLRLAISSMTILPLIVLREGLRGIFFSASEPFLLRCTFARMPLFLWLARQLWLSRVSNKTCMLATLHSSRLLLVFLVSSRLGTFDDCCLGRLEMFLKCRKHEKPSLR